MLHTDEALGLTNKAVLRVPRNPLLRAAAIGRKATVATKLVEGLHYFA